MLIFPGTELWARVTHRGRSASLVAPHGEPLAPALESSKQEGSTPGGRSCTQELAFRLYINSVVAVCNGPQLAMTSHGSYVIRWIWRRIIATGTPKTPKLLVHRHGHMQADIKRWLNRDNANQDFRVNYHRKEMNPGLNTTLWDSLCWKLFIIYFHYNTVSNCLAGKLLQRGMETLAWRTQRPCRYLGTRPTWIKPLEWRQTNKTQVS